MTPEEVLLLFGRLDALLEQGATLLAQGEALAASVGAVERMVTVGAASLLLGVLLLVGVSYLFLRVGARRV